MIDLASQRFRNQIMGCWMGKNCADAGTPWKRPLAKKSRLISTGTPGEPGGMPNDDLEMQLVWLKALEEGGPRPHRARTGPVLAGPYRLQLGRVRTF